MTIPIDFTAIAQQLVDWHARYQRDLPWRTAPAGQRDPYTTWVSEVMLQQTRVETVIDYYRRWLERFPTVEALAAAPLQDVLKAWEGLGYYARARNLHRAAGQVMSEFGGRLPDRRADLLRLPGIGEYTVGAILSLAFNQPEPILDGNVKRVLSRLCDIEEPIGERATLKQLWQLAHTVVEAAPAGQAGACNEAIMELGALICTPQEPTCLICPLVAACQAVANGTQLMRPVTPTRKSTPHYDVAAGVIWQGEPFLSRLLIAQRLPDGLLGGLWEFPGGKLEATDADLRACLRREIAEELAMDIAVGDQLTTVRHAYTHFRITMAAFHAHHIGGEPQAIDCADWRWVELSELATFPFSAADQQIIQALHTANGEKSL